MTAAGRGLVTYVDGDGASAFAQMLGGLIEANVASRPEKRPDFAQLRARVGINVEDIQESVTLDFTGGHLAVHNGLLPGRQITITAEADTVMELSNLKIGFLGMPVYTDETGRSVLGKLLRGRLKIAGLPLQIGRLNRVTRIFSVQ